MDYIKFQQEMKLLSTEQLLEKINLLVEEKAPFYMLERAHQYYSRGRSKEEREMLKNGKTI